MRNSMIVATAPWNTSRWLSQGSNTTPPGRHVSLKRKGTQTPKAGGLGGSISSIKSTLLPGQPRA